MVVGTKALELWCRRVTEGYESVKITNMSSSWRDGLGFCAIIHHFRPDLIDFEKLNKEDVLYNNQLAFKVAEEYLGISPLLDAEDMVEYEAPDRLCILTYLAQLYRAFMTSQGSTSMTVPKRLTSSPSRTTTPPTPSAPPVKGPSAAQGGIQRREPCSKCGLPVFIAERLNVGNLLFHRTCFRCARCNSQLNLVNYYETETESQFCCEVCPDEEKNKKIEEIKKDLRQHSLSDEEKAAGLSVIDDYSNIFEESLENPNDKALLKTATLTSNRAAFEKARAIFVQDQIDHSEKVKSDSDESENNSDQNKNNNDEDEKVLLKNQGGSDEDIIKKVEKQFKNLEDEIVDREGHNENINAVESNIVNIALVNKVVNQDVTKEREQKLVGNDQLENIPDLALEIEDKKNLGLSENEENLVITINDSDTTIEISDDSTVDKNISYTSTKSSILKENISDEPIFVSSSDTSSLLTTEDTFKHDVDSLSKSQRDVAYPNEYNPFDEDEDEADESKDSSNPFHEDDEVFGNTPVPIARKKVITPNSNDWKVLFSNGDTPIDLRRYKNLRISVNPNEGVTKKKVVQAPKISLNPFFSDEDSQGEEKYETPIPQPRSLTTASVPEPKPRKTGLLNTSSALGSTSSLSSSTSSNASRKKKPAPKPPTNSSALNDSLSCSLNSSPNASVPATPKSTQKGLKTKKAPLPPKNTSLPLENKTEIINYEDSKGAKNREIEQQKIDKEEVNRNRKSSMTDSYFNIDKSTFGKWKRKKGPAPSRPVPQKRSIKTLPILEIRRELDVIEVQQLGLEKQGVRLEQIIRDRCEGPSQETESQVPIEVEDLILQLFEVVNEKNELCRRQAELMYLQRQQRLEEEHAEIEYQVRCLMMKPDIYKTDFDKAKEEELISRLVQIVERRNEIIECLEIDRLREAEEDESINSHLNNYAAKREESTSRSKEKSSKKNKKKNKKDKKFKLKSIHKLDADKDIDECESSSSTSVNTPVKEKKKKKFNLF